MLMNIHTKLAIRKEGQKTKKRGFTLTEIAIVLGIIGLILGAIWVAAAAVYTNLRTSKTTTQLLTITQNLRALYATSASVDPAADMTTIPFTNVAAGAQTTYIQSNIFPADAVITTSGKATTYTVEDAWGASINIVSAKAVATSDSFAINFDNVPVSACITILTSNTGPGRDPALYGFGVAASGGLAIAATATAGNNIGATPTLFPLAASTAQTKCTAPGTTGVNVAFQFKLRG
jgi:prepilin-type N-terminal cleavage/methylation domain-containing protein